MDRRRRTLLIGLGAAPFAPAVRATSATVAEKPIPSTGEKLPVVGLGTWQTFDVGDDRREPLREVVKIFAAAGKVVDSSPMYGASESVAGDLIAELGVRPRLFVATKVYTSGREQGIQQMQTSFRRLRVERMDLMQVHNLVDVRVHTKTLHDWKQKGRIRYTGITHYSRSAYGEIERLLKAGGYDFLQINYSLGERDSEERLLPLAAEKNVAVIINRPFAEGALFRTTKGKQLPPWAAELGISSWAQYFLKWIVGHPAVTCAIPGTSRPEHMKDNLAAGVGELPGPKDRERMTAYFDSL